MCIKLSVLTNGGTWRVQATKESQRLLEHWGIGTYPSESRIRRGVGLLKFQGNVMSSERYAGFHHTLWYTEQQPQHHVECLRHTSLAPKLLIQIFPPTGFLRVERTSLTACISDPAPRESS